MDAHAPHALRDRRLVAAYEVMTELIVAGEVNSAGLRRIVQHLAGSLTTGGLARMLDLARPDLDTSVSVTNPHQHCTAGSACSYTRSHTAEWCKTEQPRRCGCPFCYPDGDS